MAAITDEGVSFSDDQITDSEHAKKDGLAKEQTAETVEPDTERNGEEDEAVGNGAGNGSPDVDTLDSTASEKRETQDNEDNVDAEDENGKHKH